jgi:DivIVA domain-containing protein
VQVTPVAEPAERRARPSAVAIGLALLGGLVAGAVTGLAWKLVAPLPQFQVVDGRALSSEFDVESAIAADGWFAICAAVAGIVSAVVVFAAVRAARISALVGLTVGGLLASVLAWRVGVAIGPDSVRAAAAGLKDGQTFSGPLELSALGVLFSWPLTAVIVYFALSAGLDNSDSSRPAAAPISTASTGGARFPTTVLRPGYDIDEVDSFIARLETGQATPEDAAEVEFSSTRLRRGYDAEAVDSALDTTALGGLTR